MTGIELIAKERQEQIEKHGYTVEADSKYNNQGELIAAAKASLLGNTHAFPVNWWQEAKEKICAKPYKERLVIAAAFIAAEIDRIQLLENNDTSRII